MRHHRRTKGEIFNGPEHEARHPEPLMFPHPHRWDPARTRPTARVDVYSAGALVAEGAPIIDGEVTDTAGTGLRRTLDLTVPASWVQWFRLPRLEVRPHRGLTWGPRNQFLCPL